MLLDRLIRDDGTRAMLQAELGQIGVHAPPDFVRAQAADYERVGAAFDYALRFGLAVRDLGRIRGLRAFGGLEVTRHVPAMQDQRQEAVDLVERAFGILGRFSDEDTLAPEQAEACFWLADLDRIAHDGFGQVNRRVSGYELQELVDMYDAVPWSAFSFEHRVDLDPSIDESSVLLGASSGTLLIDDVLAETLTAPESGPDLETRTRLVLGALLANRFGIAGSEQDLPIRKLGLYFARSGVMRTFSLHDWIAPERADVLLDTLLRRIA